MSKNTELRIFEETGRDFKEILIELYWNKNMSQKEIAKELNLSTGCVCQWFNKYKINKRDFGHWMIGFKHSEESIEKMKEFQKSKTVSKETREKISKSRMGHKLAGKYPSFPGIRNRSDGYIQSYRPDHPFSNSEGYIMEHRLVMEQKIGRYLSPEEEVHHINHKRNDNRIENLHLFKNKKQHMKFHMLERYGKEEELRYEYQ